MTATERGRMKKSCLPGDPLLRTPRLWRVPVPTLLSDNDQAAAQVCRKAEKEESCVCIAILHITCIVGPITLHTLHSDKIVTIIIAVVEKQSSTWGQVNFSMIILTAAGAGQIHK